MRISDWSSDVCSSDLGEIGDRRPPRQRFDMTHERMRLSTYEIGITVHRPHRSPDRAQHVAVAHEAGRRQRLWPQVLDPLDYERALTSAEPPPDLPLARGRRARTSLVSGKTVSVRETLCACRIITNK